MTAPTTSEALKKVRPGPVFLGLLLVAGAGLYLLAQSGSERTALAITGAVLFVLAGWVISLSLHEFAHAFTAYRFGDTSVDTRGYLTLNPLKYTHPGLSIGLPLLIILMGGIGFPGGAVYLHTQGFTKMQRTRVSLAGPATNLVLGVALLAVARLVDADEHRNLAGALVMLAFLQITATVLNILPVPGFDGYGAIEPWLPDDIRATADKIAPYGFLLIFALLFVPALNRAFFDVVFGLVDLSGLPRWLISYGWNLFVFWR
ncbi:putative peptidase M50 family protein [Gordonia araii NBRC 100433]|uniref:Putative peptidase M50 family protein n=1 Tax=Gordonia araii NBRC 100433 TaxID=1073574 RepID=G7GZM6_9ACTN|nr:site-2 protease family protein [Gordonia araii]NNG98885.1 site-2 protease family protein [Gordonia araii NBRC 100433]GAB09051.1 putative peptidase M50 family protein [Gordonia araii NBRC 100433]